MEAAPEVRRGRGRPRIMAVPPQRPPRISVRRVRMLTWAARMAAWRRYEHRLYMRAWRWNRSQAAPAAPHA